MREIIRRITKEEFEKAQNEGAASLISDDIKIGYGLYASKVYIEEGEYILRYEIGDSCD